MKKQLVIVVTTIKQLTLNMPSLLSKASHTGFNIVEIVFLTRSFEPH